MCTGVICGETRVLRLTFLKGPHNPDYLRHIGPDVEDSEIKP